MEIRWHTCAGRLPVRIFSACVYISGGTNNLSLFLRAFSSSSSNRKISPGNFLFSLFFFFFFFFDLSVAEGRGRSLAFVFRVLSLSLSLAWRFLRAKKKYVSDPLFFSLKRTHKTQQVRRIRRTKEARFSSTFTSRIRTRSNLRR